MSAFQRGGLASVGEVMTMQIDNKGESLNANFTGRILAIPLITGTTTDSELRPQVVHPTNSTCEAADNASNPTHHHHQRIKSFVQAFLFPDR